MSCWHNIKLCQFMTVSIMCTSDIPSSIKKIRITNFEIFINIEVFWYV